MITWLAIRRHERRIKRINKRTPSHGRQRNLRLETTFCWRSDRLARNKKTRRKRRESMESNCALRRHADGCSRKSPCGCLLLAVAAPAPPAPALDVPLARLLLLPAV